MLVDADFGLANVDVMLGLHTRYHLGHVIKGECALEDAIVTGPHGLQIVPAASGMKHMANLSRGGARRHHPRVQRPVSPGRGSGRGYRGRAARQRDDLHPGGASRGGRRLRRARIHYRRLCADQGDEPRHGVQRFQILANQTRRSGEGPDLFQKIERVCDRFLNVTLEFAGSVPFDDYLRRAVQRQTAVVDAFPASISSIALKNLASKADKWSVPQGARGHLEFFVERMVGARIGPFDGIAMRASTQYSNTQKRGPKPTCGRSTSRSIRCRSKNWSSDMPIWSNALPTTWSAECRRTWKSTI